MPLGGKPCPSHQKNDRGTLQRHCRVDPKPHWPEKTIPPPQGGEGEKGPGQDQRNLPSVSTSFLQDMRQWQTIW